MSWTRYGTGYSASPASDPFQLIFPRHRSWLSLRPAVILGHGKGATAVQFADPASPNGAALIHALTDAGYPCICPFVQGDTYGNDAAIGNITDAVTYAQGTLGCKSGKVILMGVSMSGGILAWARANVPSVACIVDMLPMSDISDIVTNNRGGVAAAVNAAYSGGWSQATYGATHNPVTFAGTLTMPAQLWSASDDTVVVPSTVASLVAAYGGTVDNHNALTGGHTDTAIGQIPASSVLSFLAAHS